MVTGGFCEVPFAMQFARSVRCKPIKVNSGLWYENVGMKRLTGWRKAVFAARSRACPEQASLSAYGDKQIGGKTGSGTGPNSARRKEHIREQGQVDARRRLANLSTTSGATLFIGGC